MATEVAAAYVELGARISKLETGLAAASAQVDAFAKRADARAASTSAAFSRIGTAAKIGTLAVAGGLAIAIKSAATFDKGMAQVKAVTGATSKQMDVLRSSALATARSTQGFGYTAIEVAQAQTELGKAGLSVAQITGGAMRSALVLAKAGSLQLGDAAAYTANAMQQFGMSGQQSAQVADALATAANATTADVGDFGMALVQSGAAARSAGMSFNETMTALTALAKSGVKGSDAGTSLKTSLIQLIKPTDKQAQAAQQAGLSFIDATGKMRSMADISAQLRARTSQMTQAQRTALFATLAGTDGVRTLLSLYNAGPGLVAKYSAQLSKSGSATQMAATMSDNAADKAKRLWATLQSAGIQIGSALLPPLVALASAFAAIISKFTAFTPLAYAAAAAVGVVIAAMAINKVVAFGGAVVQAARAIGILGAASTAAGAAGGVAGAGAAAGGAAGKMGMLAGALPLVANPLGLLATAAVTGAAALFIFGKRTDANGEYLAWLAQSAGSARVAIQQTNQALTRQGQATQQVIATTKAAMAARQGETQAVQAYLNAMAQGRKAGESDAEFQMRLAGLYKQATSARLTAVQAQNANNDAVRKSVDGVTKLGEASGKEIETARKRVEVAKSAVLPNALMGKSDEARAKAQAELQTATASLAVAEARRGDRLKGVLQAQIATREAVKKSSMTDAEKAASLDVVNRAISRTRGELGKLPGTKTTTVKVKDQATTPINTIKSLLSGIDTFIQVTVEAVKKGTGWYKGGFIPHFAGGGTVRGPGGRDRVPAMLTAGEVVLTKRQQAMVDGGMSIRDAIRRTGGAFAKGGFVKPKQRDGETKKDYDKRVKAARAAWLKDKREPIRTALGNVGEAVKGNYLSRFDRETQAKMRSIEKTFSGTVTGSFGTFSGSLAQADKATETNLKNIEANFAGTLKDAAGNVVATGVSFKAFDKMMRGAQASLTAMYDALTPAEAQLKALQDQANQEDLAGNLAAAQAELATAQQYGDTQGIIDAQKKVREAERAMTVAELQKTAEAERAQRETDRAAAQEAFDAEWEARRTNLQGQLDSQLETERLAGEARRTLLQEQLDGKLQQEADARDELRMQREIELDELTANLQSKANAYTSHFGQVTANVKAFARRMRIAGANIGKAIAEGLNDSGNDLKGAAKGIADLLSKWLEAHSPTEKGPMSTLDTWWEGVAPALASGLDTRAIESSLASSMAAPSIAAGSGYAAGAVTIQVTVQDQTLAGMTREQSDRLAAQLKPALARQITGAF